MTPPRARWSVAVALTGVALLLLAGCGSGGSGGAGSPSGAGGGEDGGSITVFAAASLKTTFTEIGEQFRESHPGASVAFNFAGSADLVAQLQQGAPADVFASADSATMDQATGAGLVEGRPVVVATNTLEIAVPPGNPGRVTRLQGLADPSLNVVVCAPEVPCGSATTAVLDASGVSLTPVSEESSVTGVLGKVQAGEADAGLVYVTDVRGAGDTVEGVPFPESGAAVNRYPVAVLTGSRDPALAREFVDAVSGPEGRTVLLAAGFGAP